MKPRRRASGDKPREHRIPIALNDQEYKLLIDAAHASGGIPPSTFIANVCLKEADKIMAKTRPK